MSHTVLFRSPGILHLSLSVVLSILHLTQLVFKALSWAVHRNTSFSTFRSLLIHSRTYFPPFRRFFFVFIYYLNFSFIMKLLVLMVQSFSICFNNSFSTFFVYTSAIFLCIDIVMANFSHTSFWIRTSNQCHSKSWMLCIFSTFSLPLYPFSPILSFVIL